MSGHSKWSTIKHKKGAADAKRAKIFTKIGREIQVAVREGGANPSTNNRLRDAIANAKANNMPNDTVNRSIKKASGEGDQDHYEDISYEGYGPNGVAVIVKALTDNKNRTAADVRHAFDKHGGNLGTTGSVTFLFEEKGEIYIEDEGIDEDTLFMTAVEAGAEDVKHFDNVFLVTCQPGNFQALRESLEAEYSIADASVGPVPMNPVTLSSEDQVQMQKLLDQLEESDDVQEVFHNWESEDEEE